MPKKVLLNTPHNHDESSQITAPELAQIGLDNFAPYLMNRLMMSWNDKLARELKEQGITTLKMRALATLSVSSSLTINELAVLTVTEQSTMSRTLDALEEQQLIQRRPRIDDMRIRDITITEAGRAVFNMVWPTMAENLSQMFAGVDDEERKLFLSILHRMLKNLRTG